MRHTSPDGKLTLVVIQHEGDTTIGFEGYAWHTHGDVVAGELQLIGQPKVSSDDATRLFVDDLLAGRVAICLHMRHGTVEDVSATYMPEPDDPYCQPGETIEFRDWGGELWRFAD